MKFSEERYWPAESEVEYEARMARAKFFLKSHQVSFPGNLDELGLYDLEYLVYEHRRFG